jgi:hypothetical protein
MIPEKGQNGKYFNVWDGENLHLPRPYHTIEWLGSIFNARLSAR